MRKLLSLALLIACSVHAKSKPTLAVPTFSGKVVLGKPGYWDAVLEVVGKETLELLNVKKLPLWRAALEFGEGKIDCFVGGSKETIEFFGGKTDNLIFSDPILATSFRLITLGEPICDTKVLQGKSLIIPKMFPTEKVLGQIKLNRVETASTSIQGYQMLQHGRGHALIAPFPPPLDKFNDVKFCPELLIKKHYAAISCHKSGKAEMTIKRFNAGLKKSKNDQRFWEVLRKYYKDNSPEIKRSLEGEHNKAL